jgi:rhodanese-related sulfurtransferase
MSALFSTNGSAKPASLLSPQKILEKAQNLAQQQQLEFSGVVSPEEAWSLYSKNIAILVDVRTNEERKFVGYVPEAIHVPWATGTAFNRNPRFVKELENKVAKDKIILLLCRSGIRSEQAAIAAYAAGFQQVYNILEGFEGDLDAQQQRNSQNGWRVRQLPWIQD